MNQATQCLQNFRNSTNKLIVDRGKRRKLRIFPRFVQSNAESIEQSNILTRPTADSASSPERDGSSGQAMILTRTYGDDHRMRVNKSEKLDHE